MKKNPVVILLAYLILLIIAIPWYWPESSTLIIFGVPAWVLACVLVSIFASILTAYLLLTSSWSTDDPFDE